MKRPVFASVTGFLCGVLLFHWYDFTCSLTLCVILEAVILLAVVAGYICWSHRTLWWLWFCLLPLSIWAGNSRMQQMTQQLQTGELQTGDSITLIGTVSRYEEKNDFLEVVLTSCSDVSTQVQMNNSNILNCIVYLDGSSDIHIQQQIQIKGTIALLEEPTNEGQFDARSYYHGQGIAFLVRSARLLAVTPPPHTLSARFRMVREKLHQQLSKLFLPKEASVLQAMLLGEKQGVDSEVKTLYQEASIGHILVISGLHFSLLGMAVYRFLRLLGAPFWTAGSSSIILLYLYAVMTDFGTSALRAFVMFSVLMGAEIVGRRYDSLTALALASLILIYRQPYQLFQAGFLLSVSAILGMITIFPVLKQLPFFRGRWMEGVCCSLSIQLFTLPISLYFYYELMPFSVLINSLILPVVPFLILAALLALFGSFVSVLFGTYMAVVVKGILWFYETSCQIVTHLPYHRLIVGKPQFWQIILYYFTVSVLLITHQLLWHRNEKRKHLPLDGRRIMSQRQLLEKEARWYQAWKGCLPILFFAAVGLLCYRHKEALEITMLDVGQGQSIFIEEKGGAAVLYDGGSSDVSKVGTYRIQPFLCATGCGRLQAVFVSHLDSDHVSGIKELIENNVIQIAHLYLPDTSLRDQPYEELWQQAETAGILVDTFGKGDVVTDHQLTLEGLHPTVNYQTDSRNDTSIVMRLEYDKFSMMLCGDMEEGAEQTILSYGNLEEADVLQVAHHGSAYTTHDDFLAVVQPQISLISCGAGNSYGHPHAALLQRLQAFNTYIGITMKQGAMTIHSDGQQYWMTAYCERDSVR